MSQTKKKKFTPEEFALIRVGEEYDLTTFVTWLEQIYERLPIIDSEPTISLVTNFHGEPVLVMKYNRPVTLAETMKKLLRKLG